jgi:hypothetical protein
MNPEQQNAEPAKRPQGRQKPSGTTSLVLGILAVAVLGCSFLPHFAIPDVVGLLMWAAALGAQFSGAVALCRMRGDEDTARRRAVAGIILGMLPFMAMMAIAVLATWAISRI